MVDARFAALALAAGLLVAPPPPLAPALASSPPSSAAVGSPLICFPLDIGGAASLPVASDGHEVKCSMKPDEVAANLRAILGKSDDVVVHMETLRRTALWLMAMAAEGRGPADPLHENVVKIQSLLTDELLLAAAGSSTANPPARTRAEALRWFDLGYFLATAGQARCCEAGASFDYLEKAARLVPDDLALRFGVALGEFDHSGDRSTTNWASHLARLFEKEAAPASLRKNVVATFGAFLGQDDWERLGAEVKKHVGRA